MKKQETKIKLEFNVLGQEQFQQELTELISIDPTSIWNKGEPGPSASAVNPNVVITKVPLLKEFGWQFSIGYISTLQFDDVCMPFTEKFGNKVAIIKEFISKRNLNVSLNIVIKIVDDNTPGLHLNRNILRICNELGAEIDIDLYVSS